MADYLIPRESDSHELQQYPYNVAHDPRIAIHVAFLQDFMHGNFLIEAPDIWVAYGIARVIQALMVIYYDLDPNYSRTIFTLTKVNRLPQPNWSSEKLAEYLEPDALESKTTILRALRSGTGLLGYPFGPLLPFVTSLYRHENLYEAAMHLILSRQLVYGGMSDSFYDAHYLSERQEELGEAQQAQEFLENRAIYELSFVAAFKALERFFDVNDFKKHEINEVIDGSPYPLISHDSEHVRRYEILRGLPDTTTLGELIRNYLDLRNITAAHANRRPPKNITQENIFELQYLVILLLKYAISYVAS